MYFASKPPLPHQNQFFKLDMKPFKVYKFFGFEKSD